MSFCREFSEPIKISKKIVSVQNSKIKQIAKLVSSARERKKTGIFVVEGVRLCRDAFFSGVKIRELYFTSDASQKYVEDVRLLSSGAQVSFEISDEVSKKISDTESSQGVFACCEQTENECDLSDLILQGKYAVLENVQDPSNLGAVARTAEALGMDGLILISCCDVFNPKAQRASMGALFRIPFVRIADIDEMFAFAQKNKMMTVATVVDSSAEKINKTDFSGGILLIIGNEGNGIKKSTSERCNKRVTIPMRGRAESLNASMAACIAMWEVLR